MVEMSFEGVHSLVSLCVINYVCVSMRLWCVSVVCVCVCDTYVCVRGFVCVCMLVRVCVWVSLVYVCM